MAKVSSLTLKKIEEIKKMMNDKISFEEIAEKKFKRNQKEFREYLKKYSEYFSEFQEYLNYEKFSSIKVIDVDDERQNGLVDVSAYNLRDMSLEDLRRLSHRELFSMMILHSAELLTMLKKNKEQEELKNSENIGTILNVEDEILELTDNVPKSVRISQTIEAEFDRVAKQYHYKKVVLINKALKDFVEKYDKEKNKK